MDSGRAKYWTRWGNVKYYELIKSSMSFYMFGPWILPTSAQVLKYNLKPHFLLWVKIKIKRISDEVDYKNIELEIIVILLRPSHYSTLFVKP